MRYFPPPQRCLPMSRTGVTALLAVCLGAACSTGTIANYRLDDADIRTAVAATSLGPGDVVQVRVYLHPDLDGEFTIAPDGSLTFPLAGTLVVEGLSAAQVGLQLRERLARGYLRDPQVIVHLKSLNSKKVFVLGQVQKPGRFAFTDEMTVVEAITVAGGFSTQAEKNYTIVTRGARRIPVPVEKIMQGLAANFPLQPGDIVYVPQSLL